MDFNALFQQNELAFYGARALVLALAMLGFALALGRWRRTGRQDMQRLFSALDESRTETRELSEHALQLTMQVRALHPRNAATTWPCRWPEMGRWRMTLFLPAV